MSLEWYLLQSLLSLKTTKLQKQSEFFKFI